MQDTFSVDICWVNPTRPHYVPFSQGIPSHSISFRTNCTEWPSGSTAACIAGFIALESNYHQASASKHRICGTETWGELLWPNTLHKRRWPKAVCMQLSTLPEAMLQRFESNTSVPHRRTGMERIHWTSPMLPKAAGIV